jgi:hypothetical protein
LRKVRAMELATIQYLLEGVRTVLRRYEFRIARNEFKGLKESTVKSIKSFYYLSKNHRRKVT